MRVVPERSGRMILRDVHLVLKVSLRADAQQHVVAVAGGRDMHAVKVHVERVEAAWTGMSSAGRAARVIG